MGINFGHSGNSHFVSNDLNQTNYGTSMNSVFSRLKQEFNSAYFAVPSLLQTPAQREENLRDLNLIRNQLPAGSNCR